MSILNRLLRSTLVLLACLAGSAARAELCAAPLPQPTPELVAQARQQAHNHGFLWRIGKAGHVSYLYGTLHVGKLEWMFPSAAITHALQVSDVVALEINVRDPAVLQQLQAGMAAGTAPPLDDALQRRMDVQAQRNCVPVEGLHPLRPELQLSALTLAAARMLGLEASYGAERVLSSYAVSSHKPIESLETVSEQLNSFLASDGQEMQSFITDGLADLENGDALQLLGSLADTWASSDFQRLTDYALWCNCLKTQSDRTAMKRLVDERNPNLATRLDALHMSGRNVFAAVGALHMIGAGGLPARMQALGYQVQRVF